MKQYKNLTGNISFNREMLTIEIKDGAGQPLTEIDLEGCNDSASVLDWIYHLHMKNWMTPEMMHDFLECFDHACEQILGKSAQGAFCPSGEDIKVNWQKREIRG